MTAALAGVAIVVADDHEDSAELLSLILESDGASVRTAGCAADVLQIVTTFRPDLFLLDITLPDMDGYALLGAIRSLPDFAATPAVAITGHAAERDRARSAEAGFAVHVTKPFDREALVHVLGTLAAPAGAANVTVEQARQLLADKGIHDALRFLNGRTPHRFTAVYRFDGAMLRNVHLVDQLDPAVRRSDDAPLAETYCSRVGLERRTFLSPDTTRDPRLVAHAAREKYQSYCGVLLRNADGTPFGSLCHFDLTPREITSAEMDVLERVAPLIAREIAAP